MTNFDTLMAYVKAQLQKIDQLEKEMVQAIADAEYVTISGNRLYVGAEVYAAKKKEIQDQYRALIEAVHAEIQQKLDVAQKEANQEYVAAMPRLTADERAEVNAMIQEYKDSDDPQKERNFIAERDFHLKNETVLAKVYVFAGKEMGIGTVESGTPHPDQFMEAIHRATQGITRSVKLEQEQLMIQLAPAMQMAQEHIDTVIEARRFYGAFGLLSMQNHLMELNPDNFQHFGYRNWDEVMAQRISIKGRLYDMGIDPNQSLVAFVGSNLQ